MMNTAGTKAATLHLGSRRRAIWPPILISQQRASTRSSIICNAGWPKVAPRQAEPTVLFGLFRYRRGRNRLYVERRREERAGIVALRRAKDVDRRTVFDNLAVAHHDEICRQRFYDL